MALIRELPVTEGFEVSSESISFDAEFFVWDVIGGVLEVEQTVFLYAPLVLFQLVRGKITCKEMGPGMWHAAVHYQNLDPNRAVGIEPAKPEPPDANAAVNGPNGPKFGFDTTGGTRHAVQSNTTRGMYTNQSSDINVIAPDNNNAIGVSGESVQGVDIPDRKFEWTLEIPFPYVSIAYIIGLYHITGTVNYGQRFAGFDKGELMFLGASGSYTANDAWVINHRFAVSPNRTDIQVNGAVMPTPGSGGVPVSGGIIKVPFKAGWDYLWFAYVKAKVGNRILQIPSAAYVEVVHDTGDFQILTGGPGTLEQILGPDAQGPGFFGQMSKLIQKKLRFRDPSQLPGTVVEWKWSDPNLP